MLKQYDDLSIILSVNKKVYDTFKKDYKVVLSEWHTLNQGADLGQKTFESTPDAEQGHERKATRKRR